MSLFTASIDVGVLTCGPLLGALAKAAGYGDAFLAAGAAAAVGALAFWMAELGRRPSLGSPVLDAAYALVCVGIAVDPCAKLMKRLGVVVGADPGVVAVIPAM